MRNNKKIVINEKLSREESIKKVVLAIYKERKRNSDLEEENRIKRIRELTKGKKIEIDNSKGDPICDSQVMIEAY